MKKKRIKGALSTKIALFVEISMLILIVALISVCAMVMKWRMFQIDDSLVQNSAQDNASVVNRWLENQSGQLISMENGLLSLDTLDKEVIIKYLKSELDDNADALMYYLCFAYDKSVCAANGDSVDIDPTAREWWILAMEKQGLIYTSPYCDATTGKMVVSLAIPLIIQNEQAVLLADIGIDQLLTQVNAVSRTEGLEAFLLDADGYVITHPYEPYLPTANDKTLLSQQLSINTDATEVSTFTDYDKKEKKISFADIEETGWHLGVTQNTEMINQMITSGCNQMMVLGIVILLIIGTFIFIVIDKTLKPVKMMVDVTVQLAEGDFQISLDSTKRKDEIGILQNSVVNLSNMFKQIIGETNEVLGAIGQYNLTIHDMKNYPGDFNELAISVNKIKHLLNQMISDVQQSATDVQNGSEQLAMAANNIAEGNSAQAASIDMVQHEVSDISEKINHNSESCMLVNEKLSSLDTQIHEGHTEMAKLLEVVVTIENMSTDIQKIVETIDSISFQTNILALNAAVEAARVGTQGKGFAVVAEEVRSLAYKCGEESKKTAELIDSTMKAITEAKMCADSTSQCMDLVVTNSGEIAGAFQSIYEETSRQATGSDQIAAEIINIADVVQTNTATSEETAASSKLLSEQATTLMKLVKKFQINR